jgi:hypothetical protein
MKDRSPFGLLAYGRTGRIPPLASRCRTLHHHNRGELVPLPALLISTADARRAAGRSQSQLKGVCMARSSKTTASKSGAGIKTRGPAKRTSKPRKKRTAASRKTVVKTAATRKGTSAKTTASKSRARVGGGKARGPTAANTASRARKTASKRANVSRKRSTTKSASNRSGAQRTRRTENATFGAAITNPVTEAMALGTEVVAGAIQAGGEIVAATADMANSAARTAVAVTTGVVPDGSQESGSRRKRGRRGS